MPWTDTGLLFDVIEALPHPFYVIDIQTYEIVFANVAARRLGIEGAKTCHALTHHSAEPCSSASHPCPMEQVRRTSQPVVVEHVHFDADNRPRDMEVHAFPLADSTGRVTRIVEYSVDITARKELEKERERTVKQLQAALSQVESLRGLLPICASCKRIRDDHGYWNEVESYIRAHSQAEFTHSICEECAARLYPGLRRGR